MKRLALLSPVLVALVGCGSAAKPFDNNPGRDGGGTVEEDAGSIPAEDSGPSIGGDSGTQDPDAASSRCSSAARLLRLAERC
jgi:hypothetical protein